MSAHLRSLFVLSLLCAGACGNSQSEPPHHSDDDTLQPGTGDGDDDGDGDRPSDEGSQPGDGHDEPTTGDGDGDSDEPIAGEGDGDDDTATDGDDPGDDDNGDPEQPTPGEDPGDPGDPDEPGDGPGQPEPPPDDPQPGDPMPGDPQPEDPTPGEPAKSLTSCRVETQSGAAVAVTCLEWEGQFAEKLEEGCKAPGATYKAAACDRQGSVGECVYPNQGNLTVRYVFYSNPEISANSCAASSGTWKAP